MKNFIVWVLLSIANQAFAVDPAQQVLGIFEAKCAKCHGPGSGGKGGLSQILDLQFLIESNKYIVPNNLVASDIYQQVITDKMPDQGPPLSTEEKQIIQSWIQQGAALPGVDPSDRISPAALAKLIEADLALVPAADQKFQRYFSLVHLKNLGTLPSRLSNFKQGVVKLLNFLSTAPSIYQPTPVQGATDALFRVDIRSLNWSLDKWHTLERAYPYFIQQPIYEGIQNATATQIPIVQGDWFAKFASIEPLYSVMLGHPNSSADLESSLGIDLAKDETTFVARRAGFSVSGVALHNRVIERHPIQKYPGYYWLSFDFNSSFGQQDIRANPFGPVGSFESDKAFVHNGGEIIYQLPNGLHGYMLVNNKKTKITDGPLNIVRDTDPRRSVITNGISCMSCHSQGLQDQNFDIVYDNSVKSGEFTPDELQKLRALYAANPELAGLYKDDNRTFRAANKAMGVDLLDPNVEQTNQLSYDFDGDLRLARAAETLGLSADEMQSKLSGIQGFGQILAELRGTGLPRDNFIKFFVQIVNKLQLGTTVNSVDLQKAITDANPGDVITIPAGLYTGRFVVDKSIKLIGDGDVQIQGDIHVTNPSSAGVVNLVLQNIKLSVVDDPCKVFVLGAIALDSDTHLDLINSVLTITVDDVLIHGLNLQGRTSANISNSTFSRFEKGISAFVSDSLPLQKGPISINVQNSTFTDESTGIELWGDQTRLTVDKSSFFNITWGVYAYDSSNALVTSCKFDNVEYQTDGDKTATVVVK